MKIILLSSGKQAVLSGGVTANVYFDCRVIRNPFRDPVLGGLTGDDPKVQEWITEHNKEAWQSFLALTKLAIETAPTRGGHTYDQPLRICFFCLAGVHRSRGMKNVIASILKADGYDVEII